MDFEKELLDLSEKLAEPAKQPAQIKSGHQYRVIVELNKDDYVLVSFKQNRQAIGLIMMQNLNNDQVPNPNAALNMGDELEVKVLEQADNGYFLAVPVIQASAKLVRD
jgi:predicted RNA-binding protein with RPS1 domain